MSVHSQTTRWHDYELEDAARHQDADSCLQHDLATNGRLRFAIFKNNTIDAISQWLARRLPRQVILYAAIHLWAVATTGPYTGEDHEISMPQAIARWQLKHQAGIL